LSSYVSVSSACRRPGKLVARSDKTVKFLMRFIVPPKRTPASALCCGGGAGRNPQTQVALRNTVTANSGPVSGLTNGFEQINCSVAFAAPSHTSCSGIRPQTIHNEVGLARLPLRGQCRTFTGFPFHPAGVQACFSGHPKQWPRQIRRDRSGAESITAKNG